MIKFLKNKPDWLASEGVWRVLQILRVLAALPFILTGIYILVVESSYYTDVALIFLAVSVLAFILVHVIAWAIFWVKAGFSVANKNPHD